MSLYFAMVVGVGCVFWLCLTCRLLRFGGFGFGVVFDLAFTCLGLVYCGLWWMNLVTYEFGLVLLGLRFS